MLCKHCQKPFTPKPYNSSQQFCCRSCNSKYQCEKLRKFPQLLNGDWLFNQYWVQKKSMRQIANELGMKAESRVYTAMDKLGITRRKVEYSNLGKKKSIEHCMNISESKRGRWRGKNNPNWKGGFGRQTLKPRMDPDYEIWRRQIKRKFNYTCQKCGKKIGVKCKCCGQTIFGYVHHIKSVKDFPELVIDMDNGILLCYSCHQAEHKLTPEKLGETVKLSKK